VAKPERVKEEELPPSRPLSLGQKDAGYSPRAFLDNTLAARKLKLYYGADGSAKPASPFPDFARPTPAECKLAHHILASLHGARERPALPQVAGPADRAGCGDAPTVLDALVRTILSQNTTDANSSRAKRSMDAAYGGRHDNWEAVAASGAAKLEEAIRCGGLAGAKSRVIMDILDQLRERRQPSNDKAGTPTSADSPYSLEYLRDLPTADATRELLSFRGVGPKTASCVLLFCLGRDSFAVDTHVHRLAGLLGWRPARANRDETHLHLDARIPDEDKYGLHVLMVTHGKRCAECRAGGRATGKCELRRAFRDVKTGEKEESGGAAEG
jgi:endonuclease III